MFNKKIRQAVDNVVSELGGMNRMLSSVEDRLDDNNDSFNAMNRVLKQLPKAMGEQQADNYPKYTEKEIRFMREKISELERQLRERSLIVNGLEVMTEQSPERMGMNMYIRIPKNMAIAGQCALSDDGRQLKVFVVTKEF